MSPLGLCWHNKMLLPDKLPQCPISQLESPATFFGGLIARTVETVICHLPCHWGASRGLPGEVIPPGANGQFDLEEGVILLATPGKGLPCTTEPSEVQEPERGGAHRLSDW
jgi:hypothetical protein